MPRWGRRGRPRVPKGVDVTGTPKGYFAALAPFYQGGEVTGDVFDKSFAGQYKAILKRIGIPDEAIGPIMAEGQRRGINPVLLATEANARGLLTAGPRPEGGSMAADIGALAAEHEKRRAFGETWRTINPEHLGDVKAVGEAFMSEMERANVPLKGFALGAQTFDDRSQHVDERI